MNELIQLAGEEGCHTMIAGIDAENESSVDFHLKYWFTEVGRIKESGYKFNRWLDLVFMQLILDKN